MGNAVVRDYVSERDQNVNTINVLIGQAKERGKDPTEDDIETIKRLKTRNGKLDELIDVLGDEFEMSDDRRDRLARIQPGIVTSAPKYRSAGELMWDCVHATFGSPHDRDTSDAKVRYDLTMKRAAEHMGTTAAATIPTAGGLGGLYVAPIIGPVMNLAPQGRPFLTALGMQPAPNSLSFMRPRLIDPNFKTGAAVQTLEKQELASKKFDVGVDNINLKTVGGYLNVSQQLLALHPGAWDIIVTQLQQRTAYQSEAAALAELGLSTAKIPLAAGATAKPTLKALFDAAELVFETTNLLPTWIAYGPKGWAMLGSLTDTAERPLFPFLGAANAMGTANLADFNLGPLGLRQILTPGISDTTIWIGNGLAMEAYNYSFPVLSAIEPSVLGTQVAVAEALAFYRPTTKEATTAPVAAAQGNGAVRIAP